MKTVAFTTIGCKMNQYETEAIRESFEEKGYRVVPFTEPADIYVVNTCAVTAKSEATSRKLVRRALRAAPEAGMVVTGCSSQLNPGQFEDIPGVSLVMGVRNKTRAAELLDGAMDSRVITDAGDETDFESGDIGSFPGRSRAFLKIQEGCEQNCTYCVIPSVRGRLKTRPWDSVLAQAHRLAKAGFREIVLSGTHLGLYGKDSDEPHTLSDVVREICAVPELDRVRLSSLEPMEINSDLIEMMAAEPKLCRHLHIPVQSGDDAILRKMGRPYSADYFQKLCGDLISGLPELGLGTDVIVGFPGETDALFENTYSLFDTLPLSCFHVFPFSPRPGTPAADYPDQVPYRTLRRRVKRMMDLREIKMTAFRERYKNHDLEVLVESTRNSATGKLVGMSGNYLRVFFEGPDELKNTILKVSCEDLAENGLLGNLIKEEHEHPTNNKQHPIKELKRQTTRSAKA